MKKKGILLAGGMGTRFKPITMVTNKHFLPIYNKPMFFYPLSILILGGIKDILIVSDSNSIDGFKKILDSLKLKINFFYQVQDKPLGIADGIIKSKKFIKKSDFVLILGDNFFYAQSLTQQIKNIFKKKNCIVTVQNKKPNDFGVVQFDKKKIIRIVEKPKKFISNSVVTGLYVYENKVLNLCQNLKPSKRGELEITDINNILIKKNKMQILELGRGSVWLDAGTPDDLLRASQFVKIIEDRTGFEIGNLGELTQK